MSKAKRHKLYQIITMQELKVNAPPVQIPGEEVYFKNDQEAYVSDFITKFFYMDIRLLYFFDGCLHFHNGRYYERLTKNNVYLLEQKIREYLKTLKLKDERGKPVSTPTTRGFYKNFMETLESLCMCTKEELQRFKAQPKNYVYGKTKIYDIETDTFHEYSPEIFITGVLDYDVAERDEEEPGVWEEFFESAGMDEKQRISWWYMLAVILMQDRKHNRLFYLFGNPRSGKGLTTSICTAMFGKDRVAAIPRNVGSDKHTNGVIVNKALLLINDMKFDKNINNCFIQFLLNIVGEDAITINPKHKTPYDYVSNANLVVSSNEMPTFKGNLSGLEKKFAFHLFHRTQETENLTLKSRMLATMPQIIRKAAKMYKDAVASNYAFDTEQGNLIAEQFLEYSSLLREYVEDHCAVGPDHSDGSLDVYTEYQNYARNRGETPGTMSQFLRELRVLLFGQLESKRHTVQGKKVTILKGISRMVNIECERKKIEQNKEEPIPF